MSGEPNGRETPGTSGERPADVARRALRAARAASDEASAQGAPGDQEPTAARPTARSRSGASGTARAAAHSRSGPGDAPRPGDAARAALRRAVDQQARTAGAASGEGEAETAADEAAGTGARKEAATGTDGEAATGTHEEAATAPRPADVAREALRVARQERADAEPKDAGPAPGTKAARRPARRPTPSTLPAESPLGDAPRPMAAPHRDGELRRTFPAFPPLPSRASDDVPLAETWWGHAWVTALEEGALDAKRLARGRGYAQGGRVDAITVTPGLVLAYVRGSRPRPYRVQVRLRTLGDAEWDRFLDAAAERPGNIAALLDKEMPQALAEGDVPLLPGPGDLDPRCNCPDSGHPCKHAAALCYQTARLLDADPFVLLLLRGRGEREVLDALSRRNAARAARAAQRREPEPLPGVRATDALTPRPLPRPPAPLPGPPHPEQPPVYPAAPGGPDPFTLDQLATDAAARAHALLVTGHDPVAELTLWQDAVRLAATRPGAGLTATTRALYSALAAACGRTPAELARAVAAWRQGGPEGLAVLEEPWDPPAGRFDRARPLLLAADLPAFRPWRNRLTHPRGHVQLRLGREGLWYAYESEPGADDWWPRGTPDADPVGALTGLGTPAPGP
ncbi:SWIM zinc finger family protein [Streptomyces flavalbus]|uniref:SWIM zinc finger family protein n=1 Tax=Streptomyces flavalbus TaxID=2665155 RepID=A0ABW2WI38_9ACTN